MFDCVSLTFIYIPSLPVSQSLVWTMFGPETGPKQRLIHCCYRHQGIRSSSPHQPQDRYVRMGLVRLDGVTQHGLGCSRARIHPKSPIAYRFSSYFGDLAPLSAPSKGPSDGIVRLPSACLHLHSRSSRVKEPGCLSMLLFIIPSFIVC